MTMQQGFGRLRGRRRGMGGMLGRLAVGIAVTALVGGSVGYALSGKQGGMWWWGMSATGMLIGAYSLYSAYREWRASAGTPGEAQDPAASRDSADLNVLVPMLGALLVYKHRFITEGQLQKALDIQRKRRKQRPRLGDVLLEMGVITQARLDKALAHQRDTARRKRVVRGLTEGTRRTLGPSIASDRS